MYKFLQSFLIFVVTAICSLTDNKTTYLIFYGICFAFAIFSWIFMLNFFIVLPKEEVAALRKAAQLA